MQARCFCPEHGKMDFDNIVIKNGAPLCKRCMKRLEFGKVMPRAVEPAKLVTKSVSKTKTGRKATPRKR